MPPPKKKQGRRTGGGSRKRAAQAPAGKKSSSVRVTRAPGSGKRGGGRPRMPFHQVLARLSRLMPVLMRVPGAKKKAGEAVLKAATGENAPAPAADGPKPGAPAAEATAGAMLTTPPEGKAPLKLDGRLTKVLAAGVQRRLRHILPIGRALKLAPPAAMRFAARNMMSRLPVPGLERMRLAAALAEGPAELGKWISIVGKEILQRARAEKRPIMLLNSHFGVSNVVPIIIARMGIPVTVVTYHDNLKKNRLQPCAGLTILPLKKGFAGKVVVAARRALARGEVLHMSGDGPQGKTRVAVPFMGGKRQFAAGFARIAAATNALVLPVFAPVDERGKVRVMIGEPLDDGGKGLDASQRASRLLLAYVKLLENQWRRNPANVRHFQLRQLVMRRKARPAKKSP